MRLLVIVLTILLFIGILFFVVANLETEVTVRLGDVVYPRVELFKIVILSMLMGMVYVGIIAVAEGAHLRLSNRRLNREIEKLEAELTYLRTQPVTGRRLEPDADEAGRGELQETPAHPAQPHLPSAPVYGSADADWSGDDDDAYSGGRAV